MTPAEDADLLRRGQQHLKEGLAEPMRLIQLEKAGHGDEEYAAPAP